MKTLRWHKEAVQQFADIFDYYKDIVNSRCAKNVIQKLKNRALLLKNNPELGFIEPLLSYRSRIYRSLVVDHYKIVYYVESEYVYIAFIWDCRQAQEGIRRIK